MSARETIKLEVEPDGVAWLTFHRPDARNALDLKMVSEVRAALVELAGRDEVRVLVFRGDEQAFTSGLELAIEILRRDFDAAAPDVEGALALLGELRTFDIVPDRPDIGGSLNLLRAQRNEAR